MTELLVGIYGASGFGREVLPLVRSQIPNAKCELVFVDDFDINSTLNGYPVVEYSQFLEMEAKERCVVLAIADAAVRSKLAIKCERDGISFLEVKADNAVVMDNVSIEEGSILCHFTQLTSNIKIGKHFHANIYSYVAHDCVIGDFVTFAPSVKCNGNVVIEDYVYIGTGAVIKQGTPERPLVIGKGAIIGMGAVVTKNVDAYVTVVGNPAKPIPQKS